MTTRVRLLDDAAWVSVNDTRVAGVSEVWPVAGAFCSCPLTWLGVEAFVEAGVTGRRVDARVHGHCVVCGESGETGWLPVGRMTDDGFRSVVGARGYRQRSPVFGGRGEV
ncbi:hypothetical protein [Halobacterium zhouii]|uniref:hypothetical protein n=1 Tax=Halobacterium zhouii TaxID=2902624 RepID=UPI001E5EACF7|nr:hypothetical protein [Halobacterium zhouii]